MIYTIKKLILLKTIKETRKKIIAFTIKEGIKFIKITNTLNKGIDFISNFL